MVLPEPQQRRSAVGRIALACVVLAAALAWFWPVLGHGLRNDDYLTVYYLDRATGTVRWGRVFEEFVRPWFGTDDLYRPLVSVSFGLEFATWPTTLVRHLTNVLFLAVTAMATAATAARLAGPRALLAGLLAGLAVALHPAAVEPTAWICGRTTGMQMAGCAVAMWLYARHLTGCGRLWPSLAGFALALGCKEGAVILPGYLLGIDLWYAGRGHWAARVRRLAPFAIVVVAYFAWRWLLLGHLGAAKGGGGIAQSAANVLIRTGQLFVPPDGAGALRWWGAPLAALALVALWRRVGAWLLLLPIGCLLLLAPTHHMAASSTVLLGRLVFDAVPAVALALGLAAAAAAGSRSLAPMQLAAAGGWLAALALTSAQWLGRYGDEDRVARAAERAVVEAGTEATPAAPLGFAGLPSLPIFHPRLWGVLGLSPFAPRDLAVVGLADLQFVDDAAPECYNDPAAMHAIHAAGGGFAVMAADGQHLVRLPRPTEGTLRLVADAASPGDFTVPTPWSGTALAAVEVRAAAAARTARLRLLDDFPDQRAYGWQTANAGDGALWFDVTHAMTPVLLEAVGVPFRGLHVEVDGVPAGPGTVVVVHATLPVRSIAAAAVAGGLRTRDELLRLTEHPPFDVPLRFYLLLPTGARFMEVPVGGAMATTVLREHVDFVLRIYGACPAQWFWQTAPGTVGPAWRSALDWATLDRSQPR